MSGDALNTARSALDRALAGRPQLDGAALTEATGALCRFRDELRRILPPPASPSRELKTVNALISLVHAVHFPIGGVPWELLAEAAKGVDGLTSSVAVRTLQRT